MIMEKMDEEQSEKDFESNQTTSSRMPVDEDRISSIWSECYCCTYIKIGGDSLHEIVLHTIVLFIVCVILIT